MSRILAALASAVALAVALAACGGSSDTTATSAQPPATAAAHDSRHDDAGAGAAQDGHRGDAGHDSPAQLHGHMRPLASTVQDGMRVEVVAMEPEAFTVEEGGKTAHHRPSADDNAHLMVTLTDVDSGERIPYSSVQIALTENGRRVLDTRLWPMLSRTVGMHYGENVALPAAGRFETVVTVGPPEVARHEELADRWTRPVKLTFPLDWVAPK